MQRTKTHAAMLTVFLLLLLSISIWNEKKEMQMALEQTIEEASERGVVYLASIQNEETVFADSYLAYRYPQEQLQCPLEGCSLTYRKIDAYIDLLLLKREGIALKELIPLAENADTTLQSLIPLWYQGQLYNVQGAAITEEEGFALDTSCMLGYFYNDTTMAEKVLLAEQNGGWLPENTYATEDRWRQIADETWCVMLLGRTKHPEDIMQPLVDKKIEETNRFLQDDNSLVDKVAVTIHMTMMLDSLAKDHYAITDGEKELQSFQDFLVEHLTEMQDKNLLLANMLDILARTDYPDRERLEPWVKLLLERQGEDGVWYPSTDAIEDNGQAFTTMRVLLALQSYKGAYL